MNKSVKPKPSKWKTIGLPLVLILIVAAIWIARTPSDYPQTYESTISLPVDDQPARPNSAKADPEYDLDVAALMPKTVPGHELGWLNGKWALGESCAGSLPTNFLYFSASNDGLYVITGPEPTKAESRAASKGIAQVNPGERGFTYVTPPGWDDAYYRLKPDNASSLISELVEFDRAISAWAVTKESNLKKCD